MADLRRVRGFVWGVILTAAGFHAAYMWWSPGFEPVTEPGWYWHALFFVGLISLSEHMAVELPRGGRVSVGFAVCYAAVLLFGVTVGAILAALGSTSWDEFERIRKGDLSWEMLLGNRAQLALSAGGGALAFALLGGTFGDVHPFDDIFGIFVGGGVYFISNVTIVAIGLGLKQGIAPWGMWLVNIRGTAPNYLALLPICYLLVIVYQQIAIFGVILFLAPLLMARYAFQKYMEMRQTFLSTIKALTRALEVKDAYTMGHAERVAFVSVAIGRKLSMPEDQIERLQYISILHDIGKIGISDLILNKPGRFTAAEKREMERHSVIGADIVAEINDLDGLADWIRFHHERPDGNGYPSGITREKIPIGARIIAVADAFDAMITRRVYAPEVSLEEAVREVNRCSGSQFDPEVVAAFNAVIETPGFVDELLQMLPAMEREKHEPQGQPGTGRTQVHPAATTEAAAASTGTEDSHAAGRGSGMESSG